MATPPGTKPARWPIAEAHADRETRDLWKGLSLAWPLWDWGSPIAFDVSGNGLHGALGADIALSDWVGSPVGMAVLFNDGSLDRITVPSDPILDGAAEISCALVFKPTLVGAAGVKQGLAGKYRAATGARAWRLYMSGSELELQVSTDGAANEVQITSGAGLTVGVWYSLAMTWKAGVWKVWLDGVSLTAPDFTATSIFASTEEFRVGARTSVSGGADTVLTGEIAEVRVWRRALEDELAQEVSANPWDFYSIGALRYATPMAHVGASDPGPWVQWGTIPKGLQVALLSGLMNGQGYEVRVRTVDLTGNIQTTGVTVSGTPSAGAGGGPTKLRTHLRQELLFQQPQGGIV